MLLKINNIFYRKSLVNFVNSNNFFFVFNVKTSSELNFLYEYFLDNVLHSKQLINFYGKNLIFDLFSGNSYFCFVDSVKFVNILLDLYYVNLSKFNLDLVGICYNNYFLNLNINYLNVQNNFYLNLCVLFFICLLFINLFFSKVILLLKKLLVLKKC